MVDACAKHDLVCCHLVCSSTLSRNYFLIIYVNRYFHTLGFCWKLLNWFKYNLVEQLHQWRFGYIIISAMIKLVEWYFFKVKKKLEKLPDLNGQVEGCIQSEIDRTRETRGTDFSDNFNSALSTSTIATITSSDSWLCPLSTCDRTLSLI